jgi:dolichol-phosphate mannosyltransferase
VGAFSLATTQAAAGPADAAVHASLLATLVYRYGIPGHAATRVSDAQANGQCFFARRKTLLATGAFAAARHSLCEDITIARRLVERGEPVGFYLGPGLADVRMYAGWRDTWRNWPRSLVMRDQYFGWRQWLGLLEVLLVQAAPLPMIALHSVVRLPRPLVLVNLGLLTMRMGVLAGMAPAYRPRRYSYWASPMLDLPAAIRLIVTSLARRHVWRGRTYVREKHGRFRPTQQPGTGG